MAKFTVKVEGLKECEAALEDLINTVGVSRATGVNTVKRALTYAAEPIEKAAEAAAPVQTGHLKVGIATSTKLSKRQKKLHEKKSPAEVFVGAGPLPYAHLQEFGTATQPPQRFLTPAGENNARAATERFISRLRQEIEKSAARAQRKQARLLASMKR